MNVQELQAVARQVRRNIIVMTNKAGAGHPGGGEFSVGGHVAALGDEA